jgi:exosortase/archaeosortase family protein
VLASDATPPLLVVAECSGLRKALVLLAFAIFLAVRRGRGGFQLVGVVGFALLLAIAANAARLALIAACFPFAADREGGAALAHDLLGSLPAALAACLLVKLVERGVPTPRVAGWRTRLATLAFPAALALLAFAPAPEIDGEAARGPVRDGIVHLDPMIDERGPWPRTRLATGEIRRERVVDVIGRVFPDPAAYRFELFRRRAVAPARLVVDVETAAAARHGS